LIGLSGDLTKKGLVLLNWLWITNNARISVAIEWNNIESTRI